MAPTVDLRPGKLNIKTTRGDAVDLPLVIKEGGVPADLSGRTYAAQVRKNKAGEVVATIDVDTTGAADGELRLQLDPEVTEALLGEYRWDLQQTIGGSPRTILGGLWGFEADVTREDP